MESGVEWRISGGSVSCAGARGWYAMLSEGARHPPLGEWLARIIGSWLQGETVLPAALGLGDEAFRALMRFHFPGVVLPRNMLKSRPPADPGRQAEREILFDLLREHGSLAAPEADWLAGIVAEGCLGEDHLWQDLGLWSRKDLSDLLFYGFAPLARRNTGDMKWKKFFYKQLCDAASLRLCQAPSCGVCRDYERCFGPEE